MGGLGIVVMCVPQYHSAPTSKLMSTIIGGKLSNWVLRMENVPKPNCVGISGKGGGGGLFIESCQAGKFVEKGFTLSVYLYRCVSSRWVLSTTECQGIDLLRVFCTHKYMCQY